MIRSNVLVALAAAGTFVASIGACSGDLGSVIDGEENNSTEDDGGGL